MSVLIKSSLMSLSLIGEKLFSLLLVGCCNCLMYFVFQIASVTPQGRSVLCALRWEERVSVSQMLLGGVVIAVRQEPLVLVLKVAEVRKIKESPGFDVPSI
jgi:hypothetical protein